MKNIILFDNDTRESLLPLTFTRPVAELRIGILTIREKWERRLKGLASYITQDYLADKFPIFIENENFVINGSVLPTAALCFKIDALKFNEALLYKGELIAAKLGRAQFEELMSDNEIEELQGYELDTDVPFLKIEHLWDIFLYNGDAIRQDVELLTEDRHSQPLSPSNRVTAAENIFIEEGAIVEHTYLNASAGPIYIGKNAQVMEGSMIRGPVAICEDAIVKMGAKIYEGTTIGPDCRAGGEIKNSVMMGHSNKAHEGYLGNSVLGEWCNLGADTNTSNLKNNYQDIKLWHYGAEKFEPTGQQFLGLIMGDHSKCGINTMFNTGTVVSVCANVFGAGYPRNFIPAFSWGGPGGYITYQFAQACDTMQRVMERRNKELTEGDIVIFRHIFDQTEKYRVWEKKDKG